MNAKETELRRIVDIVIGCCVTDFDYGSTTITKEQVLGKDRSENAVMTRCILVEQIISAGYSIATAAFVLNRTVQAVRHMIEISINFNKTSKAYRIASNEAARLCKEDSYN